MPLPLLEDWADTRHTLHLATQVIAEAQRSVIEERPHHLHLALNTYPQGLTTNTLVLFGEIRLNFVGQTLVYVPEFGEATTIPLEGHSQRTLAEDLYYAVQAEGIQLGMNFDAINDEAVFHYSSQHAADYAMVLAEVMTGFKHVQEHIISSMTPPAVWPNTMDATFTVYTTDDTSPAGPFIKFGFSPASEGFYERPFIYAYSDPAPDAIYDIQLPDPAYWYFEAFSGLIMVYDDMIDIPQPATLIGSVLKYYHDAVFPYVR